ncbi:MAG: 5'/3'-nucleotidase SurE [Bacteroidales bacterium]|nr:5'/3'-nucleotidase SurE [Bacteroidales bacterium]
MTHPTNKPLILVTNDDGYQAKGIASLINSIRGLGQIVVMAPDSARSGQSSAITPHTPLRFSKVSEEGDVSIYKCNGTPVDCVKLAFHQLLHRKPDLIVSGINHGSNSAVNIHYSGTMGAVIEGCIAGVPSIGFSFCNYFPNADFTVTEKYVRSISEDVLQNGIPKGVCLNVNIPDTLEIEGIRICRQTDAVWQEEYSKRTDPFGGEYFWLTGSMYNREPEAEDTCEWALNNSYVSVVPCQIDLTAYHYMDELKTRLK